MKWLVFLLGAVTVSHALTVTKTYSGSSPIEIDNTAAYGVSLDSVNFASSDFYAGATITKVTTSIDWTKTDGTCASQSSGNAYHAETSLRLDGPTGNVVLAFPGSNYSATDGTWSGGSDIGTVTTVFDQAAASIPSGTPTSGTFRPNDGNLDSYIGDNPVGDWHISAGDLESSDPLCIYSYAISITVPDPVISTPSLDLGVCDNFEGDLSNWARNGRVDITAATASSPTHSMSINGGSSDATSIAVDTSINFKELTIWVRRGSDAIAGSEDTDSNENLILEYLNSSNNWVGIETFLGSGTKGQIYTRTYAAAADAQHANFQIRFRMPNGNGNGYDYWHIDDVCLVPDKYADIHKSSCVISDPVNGTTNPKRIPGATIRYAIEVSSIANNNVDNSIVEDNLNASFDYSTIRNLQIQDGACDCLGVASASNNGINGTGNGVNPVKLDFGSVAAGSAATPTQECGYFEVDIE